MSDFTVDFGGAAIPVDLYDPVTGELLAQIQAAAAAAGADADDAEIAAAVALAAAASADSTIVQNALLKAKLIAAAGGGDKLAVVLTGADAKTYFASGNVQTITPSIGPVFTSTHNDVSDRGPTLATADGFIPGNGMGSAVGALLAGLKTFSMDIVFKHPAVAATYATKAAMVAAVGTGADVPNNSLVFVEATAAIFNNTEGYGQPPLDTVLGLIVDNPAFLDRGYYYRNGNIYTPGFFRDFAGFAMYLNADGGNNRCELNLRDPLGRPTGFVYNNSTGAASVSLQMLDTVAYRPGQPQHIRLSAINGIVSLFWNGIEIATSFNQPTFAADVISLYGLQTVLALCINTADTNLRQNAVSDVLADRFGTPRIDWPDTVDLIVHRDQSRTATAPGSTVGDLNRPDAFNNYNGEVSARDGGDGIGAYDGKALGRPTQAMLPGLYCNSFLADPRDIGPFRTPNRLYGNDNGNSKTQSGSNSETIEAGIWAQYRKWGGRNHLLILGCPIGGYSHSQLIGTSGKDIHSLTDTYASLATYPLDATNRMVRQANIWTRQRGQKLRLIAVSDLQAETAEVGTGFNGLPAVREADLRSWFTNQLLHLVDLASPPPVFLTKIAAVSYDGFTIGTNNAGTDWHDDKQRRIGTHRDAGFRLRTLCSTYAHQGRWIHWTSLAVRKLGEHIGDIIGAALFKADTQPLQVIGSVRAGATIVLTLNKPADIVASEAPNIHATIQTGGFNSYGVIYTDVGGAKTINGNVTLSGDGLTITVPIGGGGADAGDYIDVLGDKTWTNFRARERRTGVYRDQLWPAEPFASASPTFNDTGPLNDLTEWLAPYHGVLA